VAIKGSDFLSRGCGEMLLHTPSNVSI